MTVPLTISFPTNEPPIPVSADRGVKAGPANSGRECLARDLNHPGHFSVPAKTGADISFWITLVVQPTIAEFDKFKNAEVADLREAIENSDRLLSRGAGAATDELESGIAPAVFNSAG